MVTPREFIKEWSLDIGQKEEVLFIKLLRETAELSDQQIVLVLTAMDKTCDYCRDTTQVCNCWNGN